MLPVLSLNEKNNLFKRTWNWRKVIKKLYKIVSNVEQHKTICKTKENNNPLKLLRNLIIQTRGTKGHFNGEKQLDNHNLMF